MIPFSVSRHVQVNNSSAIEFYKQFDFEIVETKEHYYKRIEPADAYVLQKNLKKVPATSDGLSNGNHTETGVSSVDAVVSNSLPAPPSQTSGKTKA